MKNILSNDPNDYTGDEFSYKASFDGMFESTEDVKRFTKIMSSLSEEDREFMKEMIEDYGYYQNETGKDTGYESGYSVGNDRY